MGVRLRNPLIALLIGGLVGLVGFVGIGADAAGAAKQTSSTGLVFSRLASPARTVVTADGRWVATFTDGSRSVTLAGPERRFAEPGVSTAVLSRTWVRVLPAPFTGTVDRTWLAAARADVSPDLLASALEYVAGAAQVRDATGALVSSDASYGPLQADGTRQEGSDWNDYIGIDAVYGTTLDRAEPAQAGSLDCSGFMRMLWGRRFGLPLSLDPDGRSLPRRAVQMESGGPGVVVVANKGIQVTQLDKVAPGDLVFFDVSTNDGTAIDHVGMFLGRDTEGRSRFVSSRKGSDGPTLGDYLGRSVLDGSGLYATAFRSVRRL